MLGMKGNRPGHEQEWVDTDGESWGAQTQFSRLPGVSTACCCPRERHRLSTSSKAQGYKVILGLPHIHLLNEIHTSSCSSPR